MPSLHSERGRFLLDVEFENFFCPAKPRRYIAVKPLYNLWNICRNQISDVAVNTSVGHSLTNSNHSVGVVANGGIFADSKCTR